MKLLKKLFVAAAAIALFAGYLQAEEKATPLKYVNAQELRIINKGWNNTLRDYTRIPAYLKDSVRPDLWSRSQCSSGIGVRFATDSKRVAVRYRLLWNTHMLHMAPTGSNGTDLYILDDGEWRHVNTNRPNADSLRWCEKTYVENLDGRMHDFIIYLPLYDGVEELYVGIDDDATISSGTVNSPRRGKKIVAYGTSILQGGCASRSGMAATNIIQRALDCEVVNIGISGEGKMDFCMARAMAEIEDADIFLLDPIPNCTEMMCDTLTYDFVNILRKARPEVPIVMVEGPIYPYSRYDASPKSYSSHYYLERKNNAYRRNYERLKAENPDNLYYIDCENLDGVEDDGTVDGIHLTDLGFKYYAEKVTPVLSRLLSRIDHPEWSRNASIYEVNLRQYTSTSSVTDFGRHLPRLKELGVDILWFMPVFPISQLNRKGELGSYYAVKNYCQFNPEFGTIEEFKKVIDEAHRLGMKVILDWVPNHTGCDNPWVKEHPSWYARNDKGEMYGPYDWTDVYQLDYSNRDLWAGMLASMKFWVTKYDVDGFRCDVAGLVPTEFWNYARERLNKVKPMFMLAEDGEKTDLLEQAFDMNYNWPMKDLFSAIAYTSGQYTFIKEGEPMRTFPETHASAIGDLLHKQRLAFPADSYSMEMITNHDLSSWEGTEFDRLGNLANAFAVLTYTLPGMPLIYTGQEIGYSKAIEFFQHDPVKGIDARNEYFKFYQRLNALKHANKALRAGRGETEVTVYPTESPDIFLFSRRLDGNEVVTVVNLGKDKQAVKCKADAPDVKGMTDYFAGKRAKALPTSLKPGEYKVFVK